MSRLHMVLGDPHAKPGVSNERFNWAGRLAGDRRPDVIVNIGDWFDMESLSSYDKGKKSFEGRRYSRDIAAGVDALKEFQRGLNVCNNSNKRRKKRLYCPKKYALIGNHEERVSRAINATAELEGTIGYRDFKFEDFGWKVSDYLEVVNIDGINYSHYFPSGVMGRPIGGEHPAASLLKKQFTSCVCGHIHLRDFAERVTADHKRICAAVVGCYFDHWEDYAGPANYMWWSGITFLHVHEPGYFDVEFVSLERIRKLYG